MIGQLVASVLLLGANAFFVALEFALIGARRTKLEPLAADGRRSARVALAATGDLNMQLAGAQLGITVASLLLGYVAEPLMVHLFEGLTGRVLPDSASHAVAFVIGLSIVVFLHMVFGEMVPKNVAIASPEATLLALALPNRIYLAVVRPVVRTLNLLATGLVRLLRVDPRDELEDTHTARELATMLAESHEEGLIEDFAHELLAGVLDFGGRTASEIMIPRDEIVGVERPTPVAAVEALVLDEGHSRLPVWGATHDEPLGFVHAKDLLTLPAEAAQRPVPLRLLRQLLVVRADRSLDDVLRDMRQARVHVALVVDERGATAGLVTLEDLLEELVGDIVDETDVDDADGPTAQA